MIKITLCMVVILVVNVSLINADWQSAAEAACQKVEGTVLPGIPTQIKPCIVLCSIPNSTNAFRKLEDNTECTMKNVGVCMEGKCVEK